MSKSHITLVLFMWVAVTIYSDVIPQGTHWVEREIFITRKDENPQYSILAYIGAYYGDSLYIVKDSIALYMGYKLNSFRLFAMKTTLLDSCGGIDSVDLDTLATIQQGAKVPSPAGTYIDDSIPLSVESYYYEISEDNYQIVKLILRKRKLSFSDGRPDKVEIF